MDKITFEQLPQAVSLLIEKVGQLADKVTRRWAKPRNRKADGCLPWMMSPLCLAIRFHHLRNDSEKRIPVSQEGQ